MFEATRAHPRQIDFPTNLTDDHPPQPKRYHPSTKEPSQLKNSKSSAPPVRLLDERGHIDVMLPYQLC